MQALEIRVLRSQGGDGERLIIIGGLLHQTDQIEYYSAGAIAPKYSRLLVLSMRGWGSIIDPVANRRTRDTMADEAMIFRGSRGGSWVKFNDSPPAPHSWLYITEVALRGSSWEGSLGDSLRRLAKFSGLLYCMSWIVLGFRARCGVSAEGEFSVVGLYIRAPVEIAITPLE